jgi:Flp pilus assembly protein TadG
MTRCLSRRVSRRLRDSKGNVLIEAAVVTPLLLLLTFGIVDFASFFYVNLALENGVSQATRFAVTGDVMEDPNHPGTQLSREESIKAAMRLATPTLTISDADFTFTHLPPGGTAWVSGTGGPGDVGRVTINHTFTFLTPLVRPFFTNGQAIVRVESAMKNEAARNQ